MFKLASCTTATCKLRYKTPRLRNTISTQIVSHFSSYYTFHINPALKTRHNSLLLSAIHFTRTILLGSVPLRLFAHLSINPGIHKTCLNNSVHVFNPSYPQLYCPFGRKATKDGLSRVHISCDRRVLMTSCTPRFTLVVEISLYFKSIW